MSAELTAKIIAALRPDGVAAVTTIIDETDAAGHAAPLDFVRAVAASIDVPMTDEQAEMAAFAVFAAGDVVGDKYPQLVVHAIEAAVTEFGAGR